MGGQRTARERAEATVRVEEDVLGLVILERLLHLADDIVDALDFFALGIDDAQANLPVIEGLSNHAEIPRPGRSELQHQLLNINLRKRGYQRLVIARQMHCIFLAPVAPADVHAGANPLHTFNDPVHHFDCKAEFRTRITAGCQAASHEGSTERFSFLGLARVHHLGQHRLVELDKIASRIPKLYELVP